MQTVICMKWGTAYGAEYANTLYSMVHRHTARPLRFVCFTDNADGLRADIEAQPLPPIDLPPSHAAKPWRKISLWQRRLADLSGDVLFLDLDVVITGSIESLFRFRAGRANSAPRAADEWVAALQEAERPVRILGDAIRSLVTIGWHAPRPPRARAGRSRRDRRRRRQG